MKLKLNKILKNNKTIMLAYDQGLEHGPTDFNDVNVDPNYILNLGKQGNFNAVIFQKGIAEKYYQKSKDKIPLIIKLNGKTQLVKGEPYAPQLCTVEEAVKLGAIAVGYTIYVGSEHESKMFSEFESIQRAARKKGMPVIAWMYPRGKAIKNELAKDTLAYAARVGLELGADMVKMKYNSNPKDLRWIVKSAGKTKVVIAGGLKANPKKLLKDTYDIMQAGAIGLAIGRNIWQSKAPLKLAAALKSIIFDEKTAKEAEKLLK